jgi:ferredoxin
MTQYRIELATTKCQAYGLCLKTAPAVFALGDDRKVRLVDPAGAADEVILKAAKGCPYRAIAMVDQPSDTQIFPPPRKV